MATFESDQLQKKVFSWLRGERVEVCRLYPDGFLLLEDIDPQLWIQNINPTDHRSVRCLVMWGPINCDSVGIFSELPNLQRMELSRCPQLQLVPSLPNLQSLELYNCGQLQQLPSLPNLQTLKLTWCGDLQQLPSLPNLQSLKISVCDNLQQLPSLPNLQNLKLTWCDDLQQLPSLPNLQSLEIGGCDNLQQLPSLANLQSLEIGSCGQLQLPSLPSLQRLELWDCDELEQLLRCLGDSQSLTFISLSRCGRIKSLPNSMVHLSALKTLRLVDCELLVDLPAISNVVELILDRCRSIRCLPPGLCSNLERLHLINCHSLTELPPYLIALHLEIGYSQEIEPLPAAICRQLTHLTLHSTHTSSSWCKPEEWFEILGDLFQLSFLNIWDTRIKWLPCSIVTKLPKLRLLLLPIRFRLETLPQHLNDSLVISVPDAHVRKTWKHLKKEIQTGAEDQIHSTPSYLQYAGDPAPWIQTINNGLHSLLRFLDLDLDGKKLDKNTMDCIGELPQLTHLYISAAYLCHLPLTFNKITHLSLSYCLFDHDVTELCFGSQGNPSTLQSLQLQCFQLPKQIKFPVSLRRLALGLSFLFPLLPDSYMASMSKLFDLNTLELSGFKDLELSLLNLNLLKLNIRDCTIKSLPTGLQHLEIIHPRRCSDELQVCINQLNNLQTLSVTSYQIEALPSIARHQNLQQLYLKDCFKLKDLPPDWDELVELRTLDVSGTRIKSLPPSITKLQNLQHLIVPKCFIWDSLPTNFQHKVTKDVTDDMYYKLTGYYDSSYNSREDNETTSGSMEGGNQVVLQDSSHNMIPEQASLSRPSNPLPDITQVREDPIGNNYYALPSSQSHGMEILHPDSISDSYKTDGTHISNSLKHVVVDPKELQGSHSSNRTHPFDNIFSISQNQEKLYLPTRNEDYVVPISTVPADPGQLEGYDDPRCNSGEDNETSSCSIQVVDQLVLQESRPNNITGQATLNPPLDATQVHEDIQGESNQQGIQNRGMDNPNFNNKDRNPPCGSIDSDGSDKNPQSDDVRLKNTQREDISEKSIKECMSKNMTIAALSLLGDTQGESNQQGIQNRGMDNTDFDNKDRNPLCVSIDSDGSDNNPQSDDVRLKKTQREDISEESIKECMSKNMTIAEAARLCGVSRATLVRRLKDLDMKWQVNKKRKQEDTKNKEHNTTKSHCKRNSSQLNLGDPNTSAGHDNRAEHIDQTCSTFDVKATYKGDIVRIYKLSLNSSIVQLEEKVGEKLGLEVSKFKMKYLDEENDWVVMSCISDLEHALRLSKSSGIRVVKLLVIPGT